MGEDVSNRGWRGPVWGLGAGLIVVGMVGWSVSASRLDDNAPWIPNLPAPEWFQVFIGVGGLIGLWWTVIFARRAWSEAKRNADEAKRSADAAHETVAVTRDMAERQLRAYIGIARVRLTGLGGGDAGLWIKLKNYGQTPARDVRIRLIYRFLPPASDLSLLSVDGEAPSICGVIESGQTFTIVPTIDRMIIMENDDAIASQSGMFFVVGEVTYTDISRCTRRRTFAFDIPAGHFYRAQGTVQMFTCPFGNEST